MSFLVINPYERLQSASETREPKKKVKSSSKKGWSSRKKKKSPKKSVAVDHAADFDSYPTVNLVDEFTDTVQFNEAFLNERFLSNLMDEPVFHLEAEPQIQPGDFMLVSPGEQPPADLVGTTLNNVDPLSTHSDPVNFNPSDNAQNDKSNGLVRFFLFERKNGEDLKIRLNSSGDEQVASLLQKSMAEMCSDKIGEMEFRKKNEWIINWRKLRYGDSDSLDFRAVERYAQNVFDYDRFDDAKLETKTPASLAYVKLRNRSSSIGPALPQAKVSNTVSHTSVQTHRSSDVVESPTRDITELIMITQEPTISAITEAQNSLTDLPSSVPEPVVKKSGIISGRSGTRNDTTKSNTTISSTLETGKSSIDVPLSVRESSVDDPESKSQNSSAKHGRITKASAKRKTKRRHTRSKKISSSERSKMDVDISIDQEKSCSNPTSPEGELASCKTSRDNVPSSSEMVDQFKTRLGEDHPLVAGSPEDESIISHSQSSTTRSTIQGKPAPHEPCQNGTSNVSCSLSSNDPHPTVHQPPASCNALTISSCPGNKLCYTCRPQPTIESCPCINYQQSTSPSDTSSNCNLDKIRASSICVQNNARFGNQQIGDEHAFGRSESPKGNLSRQFHRICQPSSHHVMLSGSPCHKSISNCHTDSFPNAHVYKKINCGCHQKNALSDFGKPRVDSMYGFPSSPVCNGATHSMGAHVHAAYQHHNCQFSKYSPFIIFECKNDSPPNFNAITSSLPECMPRKVEHAPHHFCQVPSADKSSNCSESCRRAFCLGSDQTLQFVSGSSSPNHQAPLKVDYGFQNLKMNSTCGAIDDRNASVPSASVQCSNCICQKLPSFPSNPNSSQVPSTKQCSSVVVLSDSAHSSHPASCGRKMFPPMAYQVCPSEQCHLSGSCSPCSPPSDVGTAEISASSSRGTRFPSYNANRSCHTMAHNSNEVGFQSVGSYSRNPTVSSSRLLSIPNRERPLDAMTVTFQEDPDHLIGMSSQSSVKLAPQNIVKKPKTIFPSAPDIPKFMSQFPSENSRRANTTVGKPRLATKSTSLPGTSTTPLREQAQSSTGGRHFNESLDPIVISSDDDDDHKIDGNLGESCISYYSPANSSQSVNFQLHLPRWRKNTVGQLEQSVGSLGQGFDSIDPIVVSSDDDDKGGHKESLDSIVISSDDEIDGHFDATCKGRPLRETTRLSGNTIVDLMVISSDDDLTDVDTAGKSDSLPENSRQPTNEIGRG